MPFKKRGKNPQHVEGKIDKFFGVVKSCIIIPKNYFPLSFTFESSHFEAVVLRKIRVLKFLFYGFFRFQSVVIM